MEGKGWTEATQESGATYCCHQHHQCPSQQFSYPHPNWVDKRSLIIRCRTQWASIPRLPFPEFPPLLYDGDFSRCGYSTCRREAIEMRSFPTLSFNRGSPSPQFTEIRENFDNRSRKAKSRPRRRRSPVRRESPERASTLAQTQSTDSPQRREYRTGVQPPNVQ